MTEYRMGSACRIRLALPRSSANPAIGLIGEPWLKTENDTGANLTEGD